MFLDNFLDLLLLKIFSLILLHLKDNLGTSSKGLTVVLLDCEGASSRRFPDVLLIIIVLGGDCHLVCHQVCRVESYSKLTDHRNIGTSRKSFHEGFGTRFGKLFPGC